MARPRIPEQQLPTCLSDRLANAEDRERYEKYFFTPACRAIHKLLSEELKGKIDKSVCKGDNPERFHMPAWSEFQANEVGYRRAIQDILRLIDR